MKLLHLFLSVLTMTMVGCRNGSPARQKQRAISTSTADSVNYSVYSDSLIEQFRYPVELSMTLQIRNPGSFHDQGVTGTENKGYWYGIFEEGSHFFVRKTTIELSREEDPVMDENGAQTGWNVAIPDTADCLLLIDSTAKLTERRIMAVPVPDPSLQPGTRFSFMFNGKMYLLHAEAKIRKNVSGEDQVYNYRLYLELSNGKNNMLTLLAAVPTFDDSMVEAIFIGDIDADGKPDLILDTSAHYNEFGSTLYLSSRAKQGELVAPVARRQYTGC